MESSPPIPQLSRVANRSQADTWHHAVRVAFLTSLVAAATGAVLYGLVGLSAWIVVPLLVFGGWVVGCHLPPARPGHLLPGPGESSFPARVRYRTVGDATCTGAVPSDAGDAAAVQVASPTVR